MTGTVTITSASGPDIPITAKTFTDVSDLDYQFRAGIVQFTSEGRTYQFSLTETTAITMTISGTTVTTVLT